jgi:hypothetical protein
MMAADPSDEWDEWCCDTYNEWLQFFRLDYPSWYSCGPKSATFVPPRIETLLEEACQEHGGTVSWGAAGAVPKQSRKRAIDLTPGMTAL